MGEGVLHRFPALHPRGALVEATRAGGEVRGELIVVLQRLLDEFQIEPHIAALAVELTAFAPELDEAHVVALGVLATLSLIALHEGSTRIPLDPRDPGGFLSQRLGTLYALVGRSLHPEHPVLALLEPSRLAAAIEALLTTDAASAVIGDEGEYKPLIRAEGFLYHHRVLEREQHLAGLLAGRLTPAGRDERCVAALRDVVAHLPSREGAAMTLTEEQQLAILSALHLRLSLISGGPGTGKTSIVVALLRAAVRAGVRAESIALAAPTGKAANRMGAALRDHLDALDPLPAPDRRLLQHLDEPSTLHRLLTWSPRFRRFRFNADNPLPYDLIVIDEASMIDLFLMDALLDAVRPECNLVLIGDADQLPSVETGAVFRDLVPVRPALDLPWAFEGGAVTPSPGDEDEAPTARHAVRLTTSFRMRASDPAGRHVLQVAGWVNAGAPLQELNATPRRSVDELTWHGVEKLADDAPLSALLHAWFQRWLDPNRPDAWLPPHAPPLTWVDGAFDADALLRLQEATRHLAAARLLTATRVLPTGADNLNRALHARWLEARGLPADTDFAEGEPVMMTRNDYDAGLFNGDQGIILRVAVRPDDEAGSLRALFPTRTGPRVYDLPRLANFLEHAYALTVHKAQGSEFQHVALLLPDRDMPLLTREILYTAITRASRSVLIAGPQDTFLAAAWRPTQRSSGLKARILANMNK